MIQMLGAVKTKSRTFTTKTQTGVKDQRFNASGVLQSTTNRPNFDYESGSEKITYTTKPKSLRSQSNYCRHLTVRQGYSGGPSSTFQAMEQPPNGTSGYYWLYQNHHYQVNTALATAVTAAKTALGIDPITSSYLGGHGEALINAAWQKLQPDLTSVSIPNFIADIEDIQSLFKLWKAQVSLIKNVSGLYLNYKFGWKPTVGDLAAVVTGLKNLKDKIKAFEDSLGKYIQVTTRCLTDNATVSGSFPWPSGTLPALKWRATKVRRVDAFITYAPQPLAVWNGADKILRGMIDSLGFELNPRIIWDAIPFTFVVDWFFGVGSWLERFKVDALELPIKLVDSCLQCYEEIVVECEWTRLSTDNLFSNPPVSGTAFWSEKLFTRMPIFPDFASLTGLGWKLPSANQATLLVALAGVLSPSGSTSKYTRR